MKKPGKMWKSCIALYRLTVESLKFLGSFAIQCYFQWFSADYRYLVKLGTGKESELAWASFLAQDLWEYRFYWWNRARRQEVLQRNQLWLTYEAVAVAIRSRAYDYVTSLGIAVAEEIKESWRENEMGESNQPQKWSQKSLQGCCGCLYFHGQSYKGQILICGLHPYGEENCRDYASLMSKMPVEKNTRLRRAIVSPQRENMNSLTKEVSSMRNFSHFILQKISGLIAEISQSL